MRACSEWMAGPTWNYLDTHQVFAVLFPSAPLKFACLCFALYFSVMVCVFRDLRHELWFVQCCSPGSSIFARLIFCFVLYSVLVL